MTIVPNEQNKPVEDEDLHEDEISHIANKAVRQAYREHPSKLYPWLSRRPWNWVVPIAMGLISVLIVAAVILAGYAVNRIDSIQQCQSTRSQSQVAIADADRKAVDDLINTVLTSHSQMEVQAAYKVYKQARKNNDLARQQLQQRTKDTCGS